MTKKNDRPKPLPPHDGTRLGRSLAELETENPEVAEAAERVRKLSEDAYFDRHHPGLRVDPKNLQV